MYRKGPDYVVFVGDGDWCSSQFLREYLDSVIDISRIGEVIAVFWGNDNFATCRNDEEGWGGVFCGEICKIRIFGVVNGG